MTADRITAAIERECIDDYIVYGMEIVRTVQDAFPDDSQSVERAAMFDKLLQPYKYYKDDWLKREAGNQQLVDIMKPPAADKPFDARPVDSEAYRKLKSEALAKAGKRLDSEEFYGMLDLCKRRMKGKKVEPVHGQANVVENVIEAGLLGRMELEAFLEGKVRKG